MFDKKKSTKSTISTEFYSTQSQKKLNPYEILFNKRHIAKSKELATHTPSTGAKLPNPPAKKSRKHQKAKAAKPPGPLITSRDAVLLE